MNTYICCRVGTHKTFVHQSRCRAELTRSRAYFRTLLHLHALADVPPIASLPLVYFPWVAFNKSRKRTFASWSYDARDIDSDILQHFDISSARSLSSHGVGGNGPRSHTGKLWFIRANIVSLIHARTPRSQSMRQRKVRVNPFAIPSVHMFNRPESREMRGWSRFSSPVRHVIIISNFTLTYVEVNNNIFIGQYLINILYKL